MADFARTVFDPVDVPSTYEETIERLGIAIRIGMLGPGTRLPPERDLAERLRISRSTLRQALGALTQTGHLIAVRGRSGGTFVASEPPLASPAPFDLARTQDLLDWRMALELGTVGLAAERGGADSGAVLREVAEAMRADDVLEDWCRFRRADATFHVRLAETTASERIIAATTQVQGEFCDLFERLEPPVAARRATAEQHLRVVAAIEAGDPLAATAAMHEHLAATAALVRQLSTSAV